MGKEMRFVSLFAGVGGFDLGLERSGHTCVGQVEIDKHAQSVLARHWPDVPKHDDVTTAIDWADEIGLTGNVDLVAGGFPCQDLSVAGKRAGLDGKRSGLFYDALAFAKAVKAKTILLENVPGLLSSNQGRDFGVLLTELADAGYSNIEWRVLNSQFFGVAQRRRRVFIVASVGTEPFRTVLSECESSAGDSEAGDQEGQEVTRNADQGAGASSLGIIGGQHPNAAVGIETSPTLTSAMGLGGGHTPIVGTGSARAGNFELYDFPDSEVAPSLNALRARDTMAYGSWWDGSQISQTLDTVIAKQQMMPEKNRFPVVLQERNAVHEIS
jgi:site-specific DNA-cytosine methylase